MACVIRNPVIIHCLDQFGITPEEMRAIQAGRVMPPPQLNSEYGALVVQLSEVTRQPTPTPDAAK